MSDLPASVSMSDLPAPLSLRHERFVAAYLADGNATRAYLAAGYAPRGAQANASRLLQQPHIQAALAERRSRLADKMEITVERMAAEYARIAFANVDDFVSVDAEGRLRLDLSKAGRGQLAGVVELTVTNQKAGEDGQSEQRVKIKLGKLQALDALSRQAGLFLEKPAPGLTQEDRRRFEELIAFYKRGDTYMREQHHRLECQLREARQALADAKDATAAPPPDPRPQLPQPVRTPPAAAPVVRPVRSANDWPGQESEGELTSAEALKRWSRH